jgi:hypothetical protein
MFGLAGLLLVPAPVIVVTEFRRFGMQEAVLDAFLFLALGAPVIFIGYKARQAEANVR